MKTEILNIPIDQIMISGENNRKVFHEETLHELADSIRIFGVLQNLTVRANGKPNNYELITGERRYRAALIADLKELPCKVLSLNDTEFKQVMLIENVQREDIHALDEAETFLQLSEQMSESEIALKVGKSSKYIKERIALNDLNARAKDLFRSGTMQLGHALILCLFKKDQQNKAIEQVILHEQGFKYFNHPQNLKEYIQRNVLCSLDKALFDTNDADLVSKAGACTTCPKQSGANSELFACITTEAKCTDPSCFFKKEKVFIAIQNKSLLKQFNLKQADCPLVSNSSWAYDGELNSSKWKQVKKPDECQTVRVGFLELHNQPARAMMICTDKSCKVHFKNETKESTSTIPDNEAPSETLSRRLENRRQRELVADYHLARKSYMDKAAMSRLANPNEFEIGYLIKIVAGRGSSMAYDLAIASGYKAKNDDSYYYDWIDDFLNYLAKQDKTALVSYLRSLILAENLRPEDKGIVFSDPKEDSFLLHGSSLGVDFKPFLTTVQDGRKEQHKLENAQVKELSKKEKAREKVIVSLLKNAEQEYPLLHQVIQAKNKAKFLSTQSLEDLSKMAYRIGLKRKKSATVDFYASEISAHLKVKLKEA